MPNVEAFRLNVLQNQQYYQLGNIEKNDDPVAIKQALVSFLESIDKNTFYLVFGQPQNKKTIGSIAERITASPNALLYVFYYKDGITQEEAPIGFVALIAKEDTPQDYEALALFDPRYQRKGMLKQFANLFNHIINQGHQIPINSISYHFSACNYAMIDLSAKIVTIPGVSKDYTSNPTFPRITIPRESFAEVAATLSRPTIS